MFYLIIGVMIRQCTILFGCLALGEGIVFLTGVKLPSSIIGMLLLTLFLKLVTAPISSAPRKNSTASSLISTDKYSFSKESRELYGVDKPEWVVEWYRKN